MGGMSNWVMGIKESMSFMSVRFNLIGSEMKQRGQAKVSQNSFLLGRALGQVAWASLGPARGGRKWGSNGPGSLSEGSASELFKRVWIRCCVSVLGDRS